MQHLFESIRPYKDSEISEAMHRIADCEIFGTLSQYIFPDEDVEEVRNMIFNIKTTDDFQNKVMRPFNRLIIRDTIEHLEYKGIEYLEADKSYLYISNHRDIMLDSSLFQFIISENGFKTTEITFGSNLMHSQLMVDIGKSNKMFKVIRSCNPHEVLHHIMILSKYIRHVIRDKGESVWIAQRNGRTKDGNDMTDPGIIKMFCMSDTSELKHSLSALNIVPLSVSYEIESCDFLKTRELYLSLNGTKYIKQQGEDLNSIITGIRQKKGKVSINICKPITFEDIDFNYNVPKEFYRGVASLIDKRIYENYKLHGNNYIAHDILEGNERYSDYYTVEEKERFVERCHQMLDQIEGEKEILTKIFLGIYANPVKNCKIP